MSPKCRLMSSKASWNRSWAVRVMPRRAFSRSLMEPTTSSCWVRRKSRRSVSSRNSSSATRFTGPIASSLVGELLVTLAYLLEVPGRVVGGQQGLRGLDRVPAPRLLQQLLAAHPPFRLHEVELVEAAHERVQLLLHLAQLSVDRLPLRELPLVVFRDDRDFGLEAVALGHRVARLGVGSLALGGEVGPALRGLRAAGHRLLLLKAEVALEAHDPLDVATERVDPLGHRGQLDATAREAVGQPGLVPLPALEQRPGARSCRRPGPPPARRPPPARAPGRAAARRSRRARPRAGRSRPRGSPGAGRPGPTRAAPTRDPSRRTAARSPAPGSWTGSLPGARAARPPRLPPSRGASPRVSTSRRRPRSSSTSWRIARLRPRRD